jgi:hypothetical protein
VGTFPDNTKAGCVTHSLTHFIVSEWVTQYENFRHGFCAKYIDYVIAELI